MMKIRLAIVLCLVTLAASRVALAHHSFAADFDASKPVKLNGVVTKIEWTNPHIWFFMDVKSEDGKVTNWGLEMSGPTQLLRAGWKRDSMKIGDAVVVEAFGSRDGSNHANAQSVVLSSTGQRLFSGAQGGGQPPR